MTNAPKETPPDDEIREHSFDGIQEYDKQLPNWWLITFYGAIAFWIGYWFYTQDSGLALSDTTALEQQLDRIEAAKLAASATQLDDSSLWAMSRNAVFVEAGKTTYNTTCASCHLTDLTGTDSDIGSRRLYFEQASGSLIKQTPCALPVPPLIPLRPFGMMARVPLFSRLT